MAKISQSDKTTNTKIKKASIPSTAKGKTGSGSMAAKGRAWGNSKSNEMPKK